MISILFKRSSAAATSPAVATAKPVPPVAGSVNSHWALAGYVTREAVPEIVASCKKTYFPLLVDPPGKYG
ncbi:MAG: hypothetical protein KDE62_07945 [Calditrichaeota bacterium]|nr:hypothetical protein [Calditrichota bacterium]